MEVKLSTGHNFIELLKNSFLLRKDKHKTSPNDMVFWLVSKIFLYLLHLSLSSYMNFGSNYNFLLWKSFPFIPTLGSKNILLNCIFLINTRLQPFKQCCFALSTTSSLVCLNILPVDTFKVGSQIWLALLKMKDHKKHCSCW